MQLADLSTQSTLTDRQNPVDDFLHKSRCPALGKQGDTTTSTWSLSKNLGIEDRVQIRASLV